MAAPINVSGIASGIDTEAIVTKLVEIQGAAKKRLEQKQAAATAKKGVIDSLVTKLTALKSKVGTLKTSSNLDIKSVKVGDADVVTATASNNAAAGSYDVTVVQRSKAARVVGAAVVSTGTPLDLTKALNDPNNYLATAITGSDADPAVGQFSITNDDTTTTIDYNLQNDTLQELIDRINSSAAGVTARYDTLSDRFTITNKTGGNVALTVQDVAGGGDLAAVFKLSSGSGANTVAGQYAQIKIEGYNVDNFGNAQAIQSSDDIFTESETGITGLTVTAQADSGATNVAVEADTATIRKNFDDFIAAYNDVVKYIASQSTVGSGANSVQGALTGDAGVQRLSRELRALAGGTVGGLDDSISYLRGIGIGTASRAPDLSVIDSDRLTAVIKDSPDDLKSLLTNSTDGLMTKLDAFLARETTDTTGLAKSRAQGFTDQFALIKKSIKTENTRLETYERQLRMQFSAMEKSISAFQGGLGALISSLGTN